MAALAERLEAQVCKSQPQKFIPQYVSKTGTGAWGTRLSSPGRCATIPTPARPRWTSICFGGARANSRKSSSCMPGATGHSYTSVLTCTSGGVQRPAPFHSLSDDIVPYESCTPFTAESTSWADLSRSTSNCRFNSAMCAACSASITVVFLSAFSAWLTLSNGPPDSVAIATTHMQRQMGGVSA